MSEEQINKAISHLAIAATLLEHESHNKILEFPHTKFFNMTYKEAKQLELELRAYLGHFEVSRVQEVGIIEKTPSLKILEKLSLNKSNLTQKETKEANYRAYEELDKKIHQFAEWLETRRLELSQTTNIFAGTELYYIQQKFDDVFFSVEAVATSG